ncbi:MAG: sigma-70 family polymerase sigma factor [Paenibacillus sp.]|jgi:RNA polymerase sigma-70 factor (ECF subfamily)|nr:sigma-70 family polymerase sigma factor [Paenibacillus sp.]
MESKLFLLLAAEFESFNTVVQKDIYMEYYKMVYGPTFYMVQDHAATEDIIQDSFLKVIKNIPHLETEGKLRGWIKVIVRNTSYNYLRKNKKIRNEMDSESVFIYDKMDFFTEDETIESKIELKMMSEAIGEYLNTLKPEYRILIELRWKEQMSYKEIAERLDTSEETVKYKLFRAREAVKKKFIKDWGDS